MNLYKITSLRSDEEYVVAASIYEAMEKYRKGPVDFGPIFSITLVASRVIM